MAFLDYDGLSRFKAKIQTLLDGKKNTQTAVSSPSASGTDVAFIDTISQNAQGVITPTRTTVRTMGAASSSAAGTTGLVPAPASGDQNRFLRGDGTWQRMAGEDSIFEIEIEDNQYVLYWCGSDEECPYTVQVDGADVALYFNY